MLKIQQKKNLPMRRKSCNPVIKMNHFHPRNLRLRGSGPIFAIARELHQVGESRKEIEVAPQNLTEELLRSTVGKTVLYHGKPVGGFE